MRKISKKTEALILKLSHEHNHRIFGYLTKDDLAGEICLICLNAVSSYKKTMGPLENFLRATIKNRLINKFKDVTKSLKKPCVRCPYFDLDSPSQCAKFGDNRHECDKWQKYQLSINSRNSLLNATEDQKERSYEDDGLTRMLSNEIKVLLTEKLGKDYIYDFNKLIKLEDLPKQRFRKLKREIKRILLDSGFLNDDEL